MTHQQGRETLKRVLAWAESSLETAKNSPPEEWMDGHACALNATVRRLKEEIAAIPAGLPLSTHDDHAKLLAEVARLEGAHESLHEQYHKLLAEKARLEGELAKAVVADAIDTRIAREQCRKAEQQRDRAVAALRHVYGLHESGEQNLAHVGCRACREAKAIRDAEAPGGGV